MQVNSVLIEPYSQVALATRPVYADSLLIPLKATTPVVQSPAESYGTFKVFSTSSAGTYSFALPRPEGSLVLTDFLFSAEKQTGGTVEVLFTDDTNTASIYKAFCSDAPQTVALAFKGRFEGWKDARIDVVVVQNTDMTLTLGYVKTDAGLTYSEWDARR